MREERPCPVSMRCLTGQGHRSQGPTKSPVGFPGGPDKRQLSLRVLLCSARNLLLLANQRGNG
jgi:hypothetical protein